MSEVPDSHDGPVTAVQRQGVGETRVYVNERGITVAAGSSVLDAVRVLFPDDAADIENGRSQLADSRGLPTDAQQPAVAGAIFRVVAVRDRTAGVA